MTLVRKIQIASATLGLIAMSHPAAAGTSPLGNGGSMDATAACDDSGRDAIAPNTTGDTFDAGISAQTDHRISKRP